MVVGRALVVTYILTYSSSSTRVHLFSEYQGCGLSLTCSVRSCYLHEVSLCKLVKFQRNFSGNGKNDHIRWKNRFRRLARTRKAYLHHPDSGGEVNGLFRTDGKETKYISFPIHKPWTGHTCIHRLAIFSTAPRGGLMGGWVVCYI